MNNPYVTVEQKPNGDFTLTAQDALTDEEAQGVTFYWMPAKVRVGQFVELIDPFGLRIGEVSQITLHRVGVVQKAHVAIALT